MLKVDIFLKVQFHKEIPITDKFDLRIKIPFIRWIHNKMILGPTNRAWLHSNLLTSIPSILYASSPTPLPFCLTELIILKVLNLNYHYFVETMKVVMIFMLELLHLMELFIILMNLVFMLTELIGSSV